MERAKRPYSIFKRSPVKRIKIPGEKAAKGRGRRQPKRKAYLYVRFRDLGTGKYLPPVSSGCTKRDDAVRWADDELERRRTERQQPDNPELRGFLLSVWKPDSLYVKEKAQEGRQLSAEYILNNWKAIKKHLMPESELAHTKLSSLTPALVKKWRIALGESGVSARTINIVWQAIRVPVRWWAEGNRVDNPFRGIRPVKESPVRRGVLTQAEVRKLLALPSDDFDPRGRAAVLLALLCGLRLGECRGLQFDDVDEAAGAININHNYVIDSEGLKKPKWDSAGTVPAALEVLEAIRDLRAKSRYEGGYVLFGTSPDRPMPESTIRATFAAMLEKIGIKEAEQRARVIVFHSLRHTFVSLCRLVLPAQVARDLARHKGFQMNDEYTHGAVVDFAEARAKFETAIKRPAAEATKEST